MRSDSEIQLDVTQELKWDPRLQDDDIAVAVRGGVVTLGGFTRSYSDKVTAEQVVSHVRGVQAVANEIAVKLPTTSARPDPEIARAALHALTWHTSVPDESIQVVAEDQGGEKWANFPRERKRLFELIWNSRVTGLFFISGDMHSIGESRIFRTSDIDLRRNPVIAVLPGPVGTGRPGWPSRGRASQRTGRDSGRPVCAARRAPPRRGGATAGRD